MSYLFVHPRLLGLLCAACAVGLGIAYMAAAGAPANYLIINLAALVLGATAWLALRLAAGGARIGGGRAVLAMALALLATALLGVPVDGASRWVSVGPLSIQVSLIVLPAMILLYARHPEPIGTVGIAIAALALAAQPDRAMAGVLSAALAALMLARPRRLPALAFAAAVLGFGATLLLPDTLPAVPFVDGILYTAFDLHPVAGLAVVAGSLLLVAPGLVGALRDVEQRPVLLAFGMTWVAVVAAAVLGNYPTPVVGYGGSAVLGYLLSVALLPGGISEGARAAAGGVSPEVRGGEDGATREFSIVERA